LLVQRRTRLLHSAQNVGHAGLVSHESSEMRGGRGIILGERTNVTTMLGGSLSGKEPKGT
jgi:hypothetical protein